INRGTENQPAKKARGDNGDGNASGGRDQHAYSCLLQNELLGAQNEEVRGPSVTCADNKMGATPTASAAKNSLPVLDAPELQDDFYLNLVDWSAQNVLSVGLGSCVYLWSACTSQVTRLCDLSNEGNAVTSVAWSERGNLVAVGTQKGHISVWDVASNKEVRNCSLHRWPVPRCNQIAYSKATDRKSAV
ncbi:Fizzy-related protein-like protein, partial [Operophtera brumata]